MTYLRWVRAETEATSRTPHWRVLRAGIPRTAGPSQPVNKQPAVTNSHNLQSKQPAVKNNSHNLQINTSHNLHKTGSLKSLKQTSHQGGFAQNMNSR